MRQGVVAQWLDLGPRGLVLEVDGERALSPNKAVQVGTDYQLLFRRLTEGKPDDSGNIFTLQLLDVYGTVLDDHRMARGEHSKQTNYLVTFQPLDKASAKREGTITPFKPAPVHLPAPSS